MTSLHAVGLFALGFAFSIPAWADEKVTFNTDIRPILSDNCFACHGRDEKHREAKRRLDTAAGATAGRDGVRALVPGDLEKSELWQRIISPHEDEVMPPPESHKPPLKPEQRELIKRWIQQGAVYQNHWAFEPVSRPALPVPPVISASVISKQTSAKSRPLITPPPITDYFSPIDAFVRAKLVAHKLELAPEASREVLIRRLTLDLTGLPPTPEEVEAFVAAYRGETEGQREGETEGRSDIKKASSLPPSVSLSSATAAYSALVDRLLASPRYGEHFGRHWLDAVRYADTHGMHFDNTRTIWPYRDWVVQAFNRNLPFDQFTIEQLAGDLLPNPRVDQLVASGYNRNHLSTSEGGAIEAEAEARNTADRVDTTAAVWMGLTAGCASCHDHKFDPLTQKEYYSLGAIFKGLADRVWDGNVRVAPPIAVLTDDPAKQRRIEQLAVAIQPLERALTARADELIASGIVPPPAAGADEPEADDMPVEETQTKKKNPITYEVVWAEDSDLPTAENVLALPAPGEWRQGGDVPLAGGQRALRLEGRAMRPIAFTAGDATLIVRTEAKAFAHVHIDPANPPRAISLEFISGEKTRRAIWGDPAAFGPEAAKTALVVGPLPAPGAYMRLDLAAGDSGVAAGKAYTGLRIAQSDGAAWWDRIGAVCTSPDAAADPLLSMKAWKSMMLPVAREAKLTPFRHDVLAMVGLASPQQTEEEKTRLATWYRDHIYAPLRAALEPEAHAVRRLLAEQVHYEMTLPLTLISRERDEPRPAHVLIRGQYDKPGERVPAGTPAFLPPSARAGAHVTRLEFARWLVDPQHPLTARVTANRFWQQLFGAGLVRTPGDFGSQGDPPTHPELLDWLASELVRTGWDVQRFVRMIVTSRTYRQDSQVTPALLELDPANKLLTRAPRLRLDAEVLRDQALAISGLLVAAIGGPPVRPYQPGNIWEPIAVGGSNTKTYRQDHGDALYRRSLYTFWKRTAPAPSMASFDAPSRESFCVGRSRSNTPLQALALLNDVQQFEAARAWAERLLTRPSNDADRLAHAFRSVIARAPTVAEQASLAKTLARHRVHFARNAGAANRVLANGESKPSSALPVGEFAAWTMVANLLLNLDETVTRN